MALLPSPPLSLSISPLPPPPLPPILLKLPSSIITQSKNVSNREGSPTLSMESGEIFDNENQQVIVFLKFNIDYFFCFKE